MSASTGPPLIGGGEATAPAWWRSGRRASTGPPLIGGGEKRRLVNALRPASFNGSAADRRRRVDGSMQSSAQTRLLQRVRR